MKFFEWTGATIAIVGLAMTVSVANADCGLQDQSACMIDEVVITGSGGGGGGGGGSGYPGFGGGGGGGGLTPGEIEALKKFEKMLKELKDMCQKSNESQEDWLIRVLQAWRDARPFDGIAIYNVRTLLGPSAAQGNMTPPPPQCP
jgi:hypothetical protein